MEPNEEVELTDEELLQAVREAPEGDLRAFERLVQRYRKRILADCRYLTRDENNAEDLAQEVFVKAFFGLSGFESRSSFRHWLQSIKVHHCLSFLKKREGKGTLVVDDVTVEKYEQLQVSPAVTKRLDAMESREKIDEILSSMPATLRIPLVMRDMDDLSYEEIAGSLGIGLSAVKMRIKRAREQFRRLYEEGGSQAAGQAQR